VKKEKKAAKAAGKASTNGKPSKARKGGVSPHPEATTPPSAPTNVESAPQPTGSEAAPPSGAVTQRSVPRPTVEEVDSDE